VQFPLREAGKKILNGSAIKRGGGKALMALPLRKELYFAASLTRQGFKQFK